MADQDVDSDAIKGLIRQDHKEISDLDIRINSRDVLTIRKLPLREMIWSGGFAAVALLLIYGDDFAGHVTGAL